MCIATKSFASAKRDLPGHIARYRLAAQFPQEKNKEMPIRKIGVIGAGQMGNGIAHVCALAGYDVC